MKRVTWLSAWNGGLWLVALLLLIGFMVACWLPYIGWKDRAEQAGHQVELSR